MRHPRPHSAARADERPARRSPVPVLVLVSVLVAAGLAGCARPVDTASGASVVGEPFHRADAPWVAQISSGCGLCGGFGGFGSEPEHHALYVLEDGRLVLVEWNVATSGEGELHVHPDVAFDARDLRSLLSDSPRAREGDVWVSRVVTARLGDPGLVDELRASWATGSRDEPCVDAGVAYLLRRPDGTVEEETFTCGPAEGEPLARFARLMQALREETWRHGVTQGVPRASAGDA